MDALHYKVGRLRSLWQEFRITNDGVDGCDYGDQSEWARECAIQLHHYWNMLHYTPQDEIDKGMICLFANKSNPKELYETLQETIKNRENNLNNKSNDSSEGSDDGDESDDLIDPQLNRQIQEFMNQEFHYYQMDLPTGLRLNSDQLEILREKVKLFENEYQVRKGKLEMLSKGVKYLYGELKTPMEERIQLFDDNMDEEYLEKFTAQLVDLWDKCLVPQYELESADEVYELLSQEVSRLQELYAKCAKIYRWMLERRALIEKMIEFEKKASDPRRLFQSSFRLLEEEKWRKTCWPNLVKIEDKLINACVAYEETERKPFMHEREISERIVNQMFFGFEKDSMKTPKSKDTTNNSLSTRPTMSRPVSPAHSVNGDSPTINVNGRERDGSNGNSNGGRGRPMSLYVPNTHHSPNSRRNSTATKLSPISPSNNSISRPVSPSTYSRKSGSGHQLSPNQIPSSRSTSRAPSRAPSRTPSRTPSRAVSPARNGNHSATSSNGSSNGLGVSPVLLSTKLKNRRRSAFITSPIEVTSSATFRSSIKTKYDFTSGVLHLIGTSTG
ncbi:9216_t:CDS:2 [Diversispora eburnea]|uniref:9216_t:CDS:1 n=1 Tax=Diversispora eburnea TaxID=1213867 RepID=A0A9N8ZR83_9GLOM|nr:9216_t:CDS:2 [Diversispora eburnea]